MNLSQRCQYALRAVFELTQRLGNGPVRISEIASRQVIPVRFLEQILVDLKRGGFVRSHRGARGGYELAVAPDDLPVGAIIRFVDGPLTPVDCMVADGGGDDCPLMADCAFMGMYGQVRDAVEAIYGGTSFADLATQQVDRSCAGGNYCI